MLRGFEDLNILEVISMDAGPETRIRPIPPCPNGVDMAQMVSFREYGI